MAGWGTTHPAFPPTNSLFLAAPSVQGQRRVLHVFFLWFGQYFLLSPTQELNELFPRVEPKRYSGIHLFNPAFELFPTLFVVRSEAHYISSLHEQVELTASWNVWCEKTVEFL